MGAVHAKFEGIVRVEATAQSQAVCLFPVHPRTNKLLVVSKLMDRIEKSNNVQLIQPQGYFEFLTLMKHCKFIMTDSGGIQEEATAPSMNKRVFVLRLSTERPEAVASGHSMVVGTEPESVLREIGAYVSGGCKSPASDCPYGKGDAAQKIVEHLMNELRT